MERLAVTGASSEDRLPELLELALGRIGPGSEVVLVSTRKVDLSDAKRFAALWGDRSGRSFLRRVRSIDVSGDELREYFEVE
jgi:hypothetical protein